MGYSCQAQTAIVSFLYLTQRVLIVFFLLFPFYKYHLLPFFLTPSDSSISLSLSLSLSVSVSLSIQRGFYWGFNFQPQKILRTKTPNPRFLIQTPKILLFLFPLFNSKLLVFVFVFFIFQASCSQLNTSYFGSLAHSTVDPKPQKMTGKPFGAQFSIIYVNNSAPLFSNCQSLGFSRYALFSFQQKLSFTLSLFFVREKVFRVKL